MLRKDSKDPNQRCLIKMCIKLDQVLASDAESKRGAWSDIGDRDFNQSERQLRLCRELLAEPIG